MVAASRRRLLVLCLGGMLLAAGGAARGDQSASGSLSEYKIKAAYLYYFTTFVDWPSETYSRTGETLVIGVLGEDPFGAILDETLRGKSVNNRRLVARRFASIKEARDSHILFISASERDRLPSILKALEGSAVLTVGDLDQFASRGGQIAFRTEDKKVRFDINVAAVERAHLKISAQLMKLGRIVDGSGREGV
jgi:YfiR/HmsC-like